jgi:cystathionine beta-lyase/cystathionine gamma-synthase
MNNLQDQQELKHQLVLLTDAYIKLSENPTWQAFAEQFPELENARLAAVNASDAVWWQYRTKINP